MSSSYKYLFSIYSIICIIIFIIFYYNSVEYIGISLALMIIQLISFFLFGWNSERGLFKNLINPSYIALLGLLIVNFQNVINVYYDYGNPSSYSVTSVSYDVFLRSSYLSFVGTSIYLLTLYLYRLKALGKSQNYTKYNSGIWIVMIIITFAGFIATADLGKILSGVKYGEESSSTTLDMYFEGLLNSCIVIYIVVIVLNKRNDFEIISITRYLKSFSFVFWGIVPMYLLIRLVSGDRGPVMYTLLLLVYSYLYLTGKRLRKVIVIGGGTLGAFIVTIIGVARQDAARDSFRDRTVEAFELVTNSSNGQKSISPYTQELANSSMCLWIAMNAHDNNVIDYQYGRYTFYNLIQAVPFAGSFLMNAVGLTWDNVSSSSFITKKGLGPHPTHGLGTSAVADFYMELGLLGIILGFVSAGIIFRYIDYIIFFHPKVSAYILIFAFQIASISIYFARSSLSACVNQGLSCIIIFWVINSFFSFKNNRLK